MSPVVPEFPSFRPEIPKLALSSKEAHAREVAQAGALRSTALVIPGNWDAVPGSYVLQSRPHAGALWFEEFRWTADRTDPKPILAEAIDGDPTHQYRIVRDVLEVVDA